MSQQCLRPNLEQHKALGPPLPASIARDPRRNYPMMTVMTRSLLDHGHFVIVLVIGHGNRVTVSVKIVKVHIQVVVNITCNPVGRDI